MRLSILGNGEGSVGQLQNNVSTLHIDISNTIQSLKDVKSKLDKVPGGSSGLSAASTNLQVRINTEEKKFAAVQSIADKFDTFLENTINTDRLVATQVRENQENFFEENPWLRPVKTEEKSWWEKLVEDLKDFMKTAGEKIKEVLAGLAAWLKEHAVELIVGTVAIVVGALIVAFVGGFTLAAFGAALLAGLKIAIISAATDALISGVLALITGGNFWEAFGDGFADGFMWGGVFQLFGALRSVIPALDRVARSISTAFNKLMSRLKSFVDDFVRGVKTKFHIIVNNLTSRFAGLVDDISTHILTPMRTKIDDLFAKLKLKFKKTSYGKTSLKLLNNTDNFTDTAIEHIFEGNVKRGKAGGYHYECIEGSAGRVVSGTEQLLTDSGVYRARVEVNGIPKTDNGGYSTFFPKDMSPQKVIDSINEAYKSKIFKAGNEYYGYSSDGIKITMYINGEGKIISAFPAQ